MGIQECKEYMLSSYLRPRLRILPEPKLDFGAFVLGEKNPPELFDELPPRLIEPLDGEPRLVTSLS